MRHARNTRGDLMRHCVTESLRHSAPGMRHHTNIYRDWGDAPCPVLLLDGPGPRCWRGTVSAMPVFRFRAGAADRDRARLLRWLRYLDPRLVLAPDRGTWRRFQALLRARPVDKRPQAATGTCLVGPLVTEWHFVAGLHRLVQVVRPSDAPGHRRAPRRAQRRRTGKGKTAA
jgi:hypothetical protein